MGFGGTELKSLNAVKLIRHYKSYLLQQKLHRFLWKTAATAISVPCLFLYLLLKIFWKEFWKCDERCHSTNWLLNLFPKQLIFLAYHVISLSQFVLCIIGYLEKMWKNVSQAECGTNGAKTRVYRSAARMRQKRPCPAPKQTCWDFNWCFISIFNCWKIIRWTSRTQDDVSKFD